MESDQAADKENGAGDIAASPGKELPRCPLRDANRVVPCGQCSSLKEAIINVTEDARQFEEKYNSIRSEGERLYLQYELKCSKLSEAIDINVQLGKENQSLLDQNQSLADRLEACLREKSEFSLETTASSQMQSEDLPSDHNLRRVEDIDQIAVLQSYLDQMKAENHELNETIIKLESERTDEERLRAQLSQQQSAYRNSQNEIRRLNLKFKKDLEDVEAKHQFGDYVNRYEVLAARASVVKRQFDFVKTSVPRLAAAFKRLNGHPSWQLRKLTEERDQLLEQADLNRDLIGKLKSIVCEKEAVIKSSAEDLLRSSEAKDLQIERLQLELDQVLSRSDESAIREQQFLAKQVELLDTIRLLHISERDHEGLSQQLSMLSEQRDQLLDQADKDRDSMARLISIVSEKETSIKSSAEELLNMTQTKDLQIESLRSELDRALSLSLGSTVTEQRLSAMQVELSDTIRLLRASEQKHEDTRKQTKSLKELVSKFENQIEDQAAELEEVHLNLVKQMRTSAESMSKIVADRAQLEDRLHDYSMRMATSQGKSEALEEKLATVQSQVKLLEGSRSQLQSQVNEEVSKSVAVQQALRESRHRVQTLEQDKEQLLLQQELMTAQGDCTSEDVNHVHEQNALLKQRIAQLKRQVAEVVEKHENAKADMADQFLEYKERCDTKLRTQNNIIANHKKRFQMLRAIPQLQTCSCAVVIQSAFKSRLPDDHSLVAQSQQ